MKKIFQSFGLTLIVFSIAFMFFSYQLDIPIGSASPFFVFSEYWDILPLITLPTGFFIALTPFFFNPGWVQESSLNSPLHIVLGGLYYIVIFWLQIHFVLSGKRVFKKICILCLLSIPATCLYISILAIL